MNKFQRPTRKFCYGQHYKCFKMTSSLKTEQRIQHLKNIAVIGGSHFPRHLNVTKNKKSHKKKRALTSYLSI